VLPPAGAFAALQHGCLSCRRLLRQPLPAQSIPPKHVHKPTPRVTFAHAPPLPTPCSRSYANGVWAGAAAVLEEAKGHLFTEVHAVLKSKDQPHLRARLAAHRIRPSEDAARLYACADAAGSWQDWLRAVGAVAPGWLSGACLFVPFNYEGRRRPIRLAKCNGRNRQPLDGLWRDDTAALARERLELIADITGVRVDVGARVEEVLAGLAPRAP
jgi:hypothetical protein